MRFGRGGGTRPGYGTVAAPGMHLKSHGGLEPLPRQGDGVELHAVNTKAKKALWAGFGQQRCG